MIDTPENSRKWEQLICFQRGWKAGAGGKLVDPIYTNHARAELASAYTRGYAKGETARILASAEESERLGYDARMSMLRGG